MDCGQRRVEIEMENNSDVRAHFIMAVCGGFFGGYAIFGRMKVFGSAMTANLIELVGDLLGRDAREIALRGGALVLYAGAMVLFAVLSEKTEWNLKRLVFLFEFLAIAALAFMPGNMDPILALYPVFFVTSFQWCVFKGADGYACSTIFSTNNVKQTVLSFSEYFLTEKDRHDERNEKLKKGKFFGGTLLCFHFGVAFAWTGLHFMGYAAAWLCLIPLAACVCTVEAGYAAERKERSEKENSAGQAGKSFLTRASTLE